jgi:hypothetical protein
MAVTAEHSRNKVLAQGLSGGRKEMLSTGQVVTVPADTAAPLGKITIQGMPGGTEVISPKQ